MEPASNRNREATESMIFETVEVYTHRKVMNSDLAIRAVRLTPPLATQPLCAQFVGLAFQESKKKTLTEKDDKLTSRCDFSKLLWLILKLI